MEFYKHSGVDLAEAEISVKSIAYDIEKSLSKRVLGGFGGFSSLFEIDTQKYRQPVIVSSTDGVGTKLKLSCMLNDYSKIGIDLVAMCVNDIITCGADPILFLDYIAVPKIKASFINQIVQGILLGCKNSNGMSLVGGETAEMPDIYKKEAYDLAGFVVGMVNKDNIIDGKDIKDGDLVYGLSSNGFHSNGYSLLFDVLFKQNNFKLSDRFEKLNYRSLESVLNTPTKIYYDDIVSLRSKCNIKGIAHITGGGISHNINRVLPDGLKFQQTSFDIPPLYKWFHSVSNISYSELFNVFNMGVGIAIVLEKPTSIITPKLKKIGVIVKES